MENVWWTYAKRLQALATTGLHFSESGYDSDRYREIDHIARQMMADLGTVPLSALTGLPRPEEGYATPKVDVRAAVIRDGNILLVREIVDGKWTLPGGFAEIGISAAANTIKEVAEEAGLVVEVTKLYRIRHRARMPGQPEYRDFYKLFFLCRATTADAPTPGDETDGAAFFDPADLPPMSLGRSGPDDVTQAIAHWTAPDLPTEWD